MPKRVPDHEFEKLLSVVRQAGDGVSVLEFEARLQETLPRRTLQHRLAHLVAEQRLIREGKGPASRYRLPIRPYYLAEPGPYELQKTVIDKEVYVPISTRAKQIKDSVRRPIQARKPVGYKRDFLGGYTPNKSFYLPQKVRESLLEMGRFEDVVLPAGTYVRKMYERLLIDLSYNSSRLEGNTYSLLETEQLLEKGLSAEGKHMREAQMILNHKAAIEMLVDNADEAAFDHYTILNLHGLLSENLLANAKASGRLRTRPVGINGTVFHPLEIPQLIEECFERILHTAGEIKDPFEQAFFVMVHLPYLQPFEDVNKRVSRLAANIPLIRENLCPLSFVDVPPQAYIDGLLGIYELQRVDLLRDVFVWGYRRSCERYSSVRESLGEPDPFRLTHRDKIMRAVSEIVHSGMNRSSAIQSIRRRAQEFPADNDRQHFIEVVDTELMSLHEGNIARYRLRPSEFHAWQKTWR